jgi:hypothetical protein
LWLIQKFLVQPVKSINPTAGRAASNSTKAIYTIRPATMAARNFQKEASPIAVVKHESSIVDTERDMRLDDYLNDKIQVYADFGSLNQLIANVETQRAQLQTQVGSTNLWCVYKGPS